MEVPFKIIGVFSDLKNHIRGNTSAVVELQGPINDEVMQDLANDMSQPATTFIWQDDHGQWHVRWYATDGEIKLCGHGSLAAIAYLNQKAIDIRYGNGIIKGLKQTDTSFTLILDPIHSKETTYDPGIAKGLGVSIQGYLENDNKHLVIVKDEAAVKAMKPNFELLKEYQPFGYIVTAPGDEADFVSRTIVPKVRQLEDPATGSSHAALVPFWSEKLNKPELSALQLSKRGGSFSCKYEQQSVKLTGKVFELASGLISISK